MGRRPKNVKITKCVGLSTPREVCLSCEKDECIFEHGTPKNFKNVRNPGEIYSVKKIRTMIKSGKESIVYLTQFPHTKVVTAADVRQAALFTREVAAQACAKAESLIKYKSTFRIIIKEREIERVNNSK